MDRVDAMVANVLASLPKGSHMQAVRDDQLVLMRITPPKRKATKRPGYREFVEYLAYNDDESMLRDGDPSVCVSMVAHLFDKETDTVIADVLRYLEKHDA
jgi:hypothetical protein